METDKEHRTARERALSLLPAIAAAAVALLASIAFGLSFGLSYGVDNQVVYFLGALRKLDPGVLGNDWYTAGSANYHPAFSYVGWLLLAIDRGGWAVGVALVAVTAAGALALYWLTHELLGKRLGLAAFLLLLGIAFATRTRGVAVSYLFDFILQPSTLGSLFLLLALPPFVAGRYLLSGVFLGLSGLFHANYLILGIGTFGLAHLALGVRDIKELALRLARQLGPAFVAFLLLSPLIFASIGSKDGARAQEILFSIRAPHHYAPRNWKGAFFPMAAWQMVGLGAGAWLLRGMSGRGRRLGALILALAVVLWAGTALTTWKWYPRVAQLFVWRFAPLQDLLMQLLVCVASVRIAARPALLRRIGPAGLALLAGGVASIALQDKEGPAPGPLEALFAALLPAAAGVGIAAAGALLERLRLKLDKPRALLLRHGAWALLPYAVLACHWVGKYQVDEYRERSNLMKPFTGPEADLYTWIRANTPKEALFLTPPSMERFRLRAERAIVVDWKGSAILPGELVEWYRRLEDVSGRPGFRRFDDLNSGYAGLDAARLEALAAKYKLDYAVVGRGRESALPGAVVYKNASYAVVKLGG